MGAVQEIFGQDFMIIIFRRGPEAIVIVAWRLRAACSATPVFMRFL
jgi:hypothetical protein